MFGFLDNLIEGIFGRNGFSSVLKTVAGVAFMGGVGYLAYKGVKAITSKKSSPTPSGQASKVSSQNTISSGSSGSNVKWDGTKWVPVSSGSLQYCDLPSSDPRYNKYACGEKSEEQTDGEDTYRIAFEAFTISQKEGTAKVEDISDRGSTWTTKLTAGDGTVLYKDSSGNIATKNDAGAWVITDSSGKYVETQG